jgi:hypothetical protein
MVGTSDEALSFIQEFTLRRFNPKVEKQVVPPPKPKPSASNHTNNDTPSSSSSTTSSIPNTQSEGLFPSLPLNQQPYETMWPVNINVHQKKDDEYFAG